MDFFFEEFDLQSLRLQFVCLDLVFILLGWFVFIGCVLLNLGGSMLFIVDNGLGSLIDLWLGMNNEMFEDKEE